MTFIKFLIFFNLFLIVNVSFAKKTQYDTEADFRQLSSELRCLVCQNQSLLDSDSDLAKDLKKLILDMLNEGKSKKEIKQYLVVRYGEFILFRPLFNETNVLLWLAPILSFLLIGFIGIRKFKINLKK